MAPRQFAFVAWPEKALLDLVHLTARGDEARWLAELRLQNTDGLSLPRLAELAERSGRAKLRRAADRLAPILAEGTGEAL